MVAIHTDYENNGETFWDHLTRDVICQAPLSHEARQAIGGLVEGGLDEIEVSEEVAAELMEWFATLPGWSEEDAPEYAPNPVHVS